MEPGKWDLPGGHIEEGETPEECIRREMEEELELKLPEEISLIQKHDWPEYYEYIYHVRGDFRTDKMTLHEGQDMGFFFFKEILAADTAFYCRKILLEFISKNKEKI